MPLAHDQFDNGNRIKRFGIGDSIPMKQISAKKMQNAIERIFDDQSIEARCKDYASRIQKRDGLQRSAIAIEERIRDSQ
jgi:UDP:flavonoid glycosyltransferase YjiC (YdhE family)